MPIISHKGKDYDAPVYDVQDNSSATTLDAVKIPTGRTITSFVNSALETKADNEFTDAWITSYSTSAHSFIVTENSKKSVKTLIKDTQNFLGSVLADITNWKVSDSQLRMGLPESYSTSTHSFDEMSSANYNLSDSLTLIQNTSDNLVTAINDHTTWITSSYYTKSEVNNLLSALETKIDWKEAVATYNDIATTYPNPEDGWTVNVKDTDYTYRYSGSKWVAISANAIPEATTSVNGLMTTAMVTKLNGIAAGAQVNTITGIKGNAESTYRTGNVNLTPTNIGAVDKSGDTMTGALRIDPNIVQLMFRNQANYYTTASYQTGGNEALVFASKNGVTSFMFVNGEDSVTNHAHDRWQSLTPGLQIKNNKVAIGKLIANGTDLTYPLEVNGDVQATNFRGALVGNANTATKATQDSDGNTINTTYMKKGIDYVTAGKSDSSTLGSNATAEGCIVTASGTDSHAEGYNTQAIGYAAHAEGYRTVSGATGSNNYGAHAEGYVTKGTGYASHAEGLFTEAKGMGAHAEGYGTIARVYQHVEGKFNVEDTNNVYAHIIGGGSDDSNKKNIFTVDWNGDVCAGRSNGLTNDLKLPTGADVISYLNSNLRCNEIKSMVDISNYTSQLYTAPYDGYIFITGTGTQAQIWSATAQYYFYIMTRDGQPKTIYIRKGMRIKIVPGTANNAARFYPITN